MAVAQQRKIDVMFVYLLFCRDFHSQANKATQVQFLKLFLNNERAAQLSIQEIFSYTSKVLPTDTPRDELLQFTEDILFKFFRLNSSLPIENSSEMTALMCSLH